MSLMPKCCNLYNILKYFCYLSNSCFVPQLGTPMEISLCNWLFGLSQIKSTVILFCLFFCIFVFLACHPLFFLIFI